MRKCAIAAIFNLLPLIFYKSWSAGAILHVIQGAKTKQTVKVLQPFMAGKVFTISVFKKTM